MNGSNDAFLQEEYISRINRVQDYIEANMDEELSLTVLSKVANFSPYHFHRIFSAIAGEPLSKYIQRIRLERAALSLAANRKDTITQIALKCGFSNQASFSRAFRKHFGFNASQLRMDANLLKSKKCKTESKPGKDSPVTFSYNSAEGNIEVKELQETPVIYIRNTGMFEGEPELFGKLLGRLFAWAGARGLVDSYTKILSVYHDNADITEETRFRTSICLTVPGDARTEGEIGKMTLSGGKYAIGHFILDACQYKGAWDFLYGEWLPVSGYQPDDRPYYEIYLNDPRQHPEKKSIVDMYIPVRPL